MTKEDELKIILYEFYINRKHQMPHKYFDVTKDIWDVFHPRFDWITFRILGDLWIFNLKSPDINNARKSIFWTCLDGTIVRERIELEL